MDYKETIQFLYTQLPMFSRDGSSAFKKDLSNTLALCEVLGNPQNLFKSIHVAGTNGKGSTSHMLAAVLQEAGYKTGLYTSPHLYDFRERIKVNGALCSESFVVSFVEKIKPALEKIAPSFFEITVAMAFDYFAAQQVDVAVIETGLGGRLDSTNIISPQLSLITNIGMDHMQFLGNTLPEIAAEKAGIIKNSVPVVISEYLSETRPVFEKFATEKDAPIYFGQDLWQVAVIEEAVSSQNNKELSLLTVQVQRGKSSTDTGINTTAVSPCTYQLELTGGYQIKNIVGVLESIYQLRKSGWKITEQAVVSGLKHVKTLTGIFGRWDEVLKDPWIITDVGHNVDGIKMIKAQLSRMHYKNLHLITGFVKDKDVSASLRALPTDANYYFTQALIPRAMPASELKELAGKFNLNGEAFKDITTALGAALVTYQKGDLVLICGSVFLVAEVKGALDELRFSL